MKRMISILLAALLAMSAPMFAEELPLETEPTTCPVPAEEADFSIGLAAPVEAAAYEAPVSKESTSTEALVEATRTLENTAATPEPAPVYPTYTVKNKSTLKLDKGNQVQIAVSGKAIKSCKSSKKKVVSVSKSGFITAKAAGTAKITITTTDKKKIKVIVKVTDPTIPTGISISNGKKATLYRGQTLSLTAAMKPATATSKLTWKSSNKKVASVNSDGVITAKKAGKTTITVKTHNGKKATIKITVTKSSMPHTHTWEEVTETVTVVDTPAWDEIIEDEPPSITTVEHPAEGHWETIQVPAVTHVVHHDAVTHTEQKWVVDKAAWTETKYKAVVVCNDCGARFDTYDAWKAHQKAQMRAAMAAQEAGETYTGPQCGSYGSIQVADGTIEHPEEGHYETVTITDSQAWDETVTDKPATRDYVIDKAAWTETITVTDKAAWEEKVWKVDKAAWTETKTVTDTEAHDEQVWVVDKKATTKTVVTGQRCETCGETKAK